MLFFFLVPQPSAVEQEKSERFNFKSPFLGLTLFISVSCNYYHMFLNINLNSVQACYRNRFIPVEEQGHSDSHDMLRLKPSRSQHGKTTGKSSLHL